MKQTSAIRYTPYAKNMLRIAVCDVLELAGCHDYWEGRQDGAEIVTASVEVLDHQSEFFFHIQEWCLGSLLTVTITRPSSGLSRAGEQRSVNNLTDRVISLWKTPLKSVPSGKGKRCGSPQGSGNIKAPCGPCWAKRRGSEGTEDNPGKRSL